LKYNLFLLIFFFSFFINARMDFEKRGKWLNVLPFGVGQYQNYQEKKAFIFLTTESIFLGTAVTTAFMSMGNDENYKLRKIEKISFAIFLSIYLWGVYDAFKNYESAEKKIFEQMEKKIGFYPAIKKDFMGLEVALRF
jgi:hypothetical protein